MPVVSIFLARVKAGYECIKAFSETDFTEDLKAIDVPVLVIHSEDDQIVPYANSAPLTVSAREPAGSRGLHDGQPFAPLECG
jgi:pimeloyl-ACP methyl ester carboxylesterase